MLITNSGWDIKYNLVSIWGCEKPIWFGKEFMPYPHFKVYDFEAILASPNEHSTDIMTYLLRHTTLSVAI